jgi:hypothetical protein
MYSQINHTLQSDKINADLILIFNPFYLLLQNKTNLTHTD